MKALELAIPPVAQMIIIAIVMWFFSLAGSTASVDMLGIVLLAGFFGFTGCVISLLGVAAFRKAKTTVDPRTPRETKKLVLSGIYQLSRNPMYLGFLTILIGWSLYLSNIYAFPLLPVFVLYMNRFQIIPEERFMLEKFGDEYVLYQNLF